MLKSISQKTIETLIYVRDKGEMIQAVDMARDVRKSLSHEASCRAYLRKLTVGGLLNSIESRKESPRFSLSKDGEFVLWMVGLGFARTDGRWLDRDGKRLDEVTLMDLREEFGSA